ncbi:unnamed protein product [Rhizoctonia solani]|uniref:Uncharacterized protein n=1 Tax=Rhizoctonia solani TaxID=456999 RepID=A0A8H3CVD6_9AGAM|nr:unnamed protein product [Rhizoctonia solani]
MHTTLPLNKPCPQTTSPLAISQSAPKRETIVHEGHKRRVLSVAFSPDGNSVASGSDDYTIRIWDVQTPSQVIRPLRGHSRGILSVSYSPRFTLLASGSVDRTICVWSTSTGQLVSKPLVGHRRSVTTVAFSPTTNVIVSGSNDTTIRLWRLNDKKYTSKSFTAVLGKSNPLRFPLMEIV